MMVTVLAFAFAVCLALYVRQATEIRRSIAQGLEQATEPDAGPEARPDDKTVEALLSYDPLKEEFAKLEAEVRKREWIAAEVGMWNTMFKMEMECHRLKQEKRERKMKRRAVA